MATAEEQQREREEAKQQLENLLNTSRPKNLGEGVSGGLSNIVAGAVGAAGVAVLLPTIGLATGLRGGGIIGGALGVAVGAVAGAVGAAALAVGGAVSGVVQIGRGIAAVPQSIIAPREGKWWNEKLGKWVLTDMEEERKKLLNIPEDDSDILNKVQSELDASAELGNSKEVADMYYYDCLEVPSNAEPSLIKRRYYVLARQYHPDKVGADDKEAAEKFKEIAEAYQVLSDPELRKKYDTDGRAGLSPDKTSTVGSGMQGIDPALLFAFLFGSDKFHDYVGRLSTATSASVGDSPKISVKDAHKLQERRVARMAIFLLQKITPWVEVSKVNADPAIVADIESTWTNEAIELTKASFGYQMVTTIGKAYNLVAVVYKGSADSGQGLPSLSKWAAKNKASMDSKNAKSKNTFDAMKAGMDMMKIRAEFEQKMQQATTDDEKNAITKEMQDATVGVLIRILWTTTVVDITTALHEATQMVFFDRSVDKETRKLRADAVEKLGSIWMNVPDTDGNQSKDSKQLYEEAAFAAMVETMKRKDDASHDANA